MLWRRESALPLVDAGAFARARRRTLVLRLRLRVVALALVGVAVLAGAVAEVPAESALPQGRSGVVVVDLSRSIGPQPEHLLLDAFRRLDSPDGRPGVGVFSAPPSELLP